jgi:hypothetical protein
MEDYQEKGVEFYARIASEWGLEREIVPPGL